MKDCIIHNYDNFDVRICELSHTGNTLPYETVIRQPCVIIIPIIEDNVIMISEYRAAIGQWICQFPSGKINSEINEFPGSAARRELLEETGYQAEECVYAGCFFTAPHFSDELFHIFIARTLTKQAQNPTKRELIQVKSVKLSDIENILFCQEGIDAKTVTAYYTWKRGFTR